VKKTARRADRMALGRLLSRFTRKRQCQPESSRSRAVVTMLTGGKTRTRRMRRRRSAPREAPPI
jgi:hypothetical protein